MSEPLRQLPSSREEKRGPPARLGPLGRPLSLITSSDDREFLPAALEILETPASPWRIVFIWIVCLMTTGALVWSCIAKLDIYAVASGRIEPIGRSKVVQSLDPGKVKGIYVANGSKVKAGAALIDLDPTEAYAARASAAGDLEAAEAEIARRRTEIQAVLSDKPSMGEIEFPQAVGKVARMRARQVMAAELAQYVSSMETYQAQLAENAATKDRLTATLAQREQLVTVLKKRLAMKQELVTKQVGTLTAVLDAQQQLDQELTNIVDAKGQLAETLATTASTKRKAAQFRDQFLADQADKLETAIVSRDRLAQTLVKAAAQAERTLLAAPVSGTVQQLAVTTIGQVVQPGQPLLVIVPDGAQIEIQALVENSDIGFIKVGQEAVIKIDAFPFTRYGTIDGKVVRLSRDAVYDKDASTADAATLPQAQNASVLDTTPKTQGLVYPVWVKLARTDVNVDGRDVALSAGMTAKIEIRTGDRRVIDYLLSPLREMASSAGHER